MNDCLNLILGLDERHSFKRSWNSGKKGEKGPNGPLSYSHNTFYLKIPRSNISLSVPKSVCSLSSAVKTPAFRVSPTRI